MLWRLYRRGLGPHVRVLNEFWDKSWNSDFYLRTKKSKKITFGKKKKKKRNRHVTLILTHKTFCASAGKYFSQGEPRANMSNVSNLLVCTSILSRTCFRSSHYCLLACWVQVTHIQLSSLLTIVRARRCPLGLRASVEYSVQMVSLSGRDYYH